MFVVRYFRSRHNAFKSLDIVGKIKMADGVEKVLTDILKHIGNMNGETAADTLKEMRANNRYQEDKFG